MDRELFGQLVKDNTELFKKTCSDVKYEERCISNGEGLFLWSAISYYKPEILVESGVFRGRSTELIARSYVINEYKKFYAFDHLPTNHSYVLEKLKPYNNIVHEIGESQDKIPSIRQQIKHNTVGAFVDGPKFGQKLFAVIKSLVKLPKLQFIMFHDFKEGGLMRRDVVKYYNDNLKENFGLMLLDKSLIEDISVNDKLKEEMSRVNPDKLYLLDWECFEMGFIYRK